MKKIYIPFWLDFNLNNLNPLKPYYPYLHSILVRFQQGCLCFVL